LFSYKAILERNFVWARAKITETVTQVDTTADEQHRALLHAKLMESISPEQIERELAAIADEVASHFAGRLHEATETMRLRYLTRNADIQTFLIGLSIDASDGTASNRFALRSLAVKPDDVAKAGVVALTTSKVFQLLGKRYISVADVTALKFCGGLANAMPTCKKVTTAVYVGTRKVLTHMGLRTAQVAKWANPIGAISGAAYLAYSEYSEHQDTKTKGSLAIKGELSRQLAKRIDGMLALDGELGGALRELNRKIATAVANG
jgi:hypothetical protein